MKKKDNHLAAVAILATRTNILTGHLRLNSKLKSQLVTRHMATLFPIETNKGFDTSLLEIGYPSEPVLAECSARFMSDRAVLVDILSLLNGFISNECPLSDGSQMKQIVLLVAKDQADLEVNAGCDSLPITVEQFLTCLVGKDNFKEHFEKRVSSEFKEGLVCFSHFTSKSSALQTRDLVLDLIGRCSAGVFSSCLSLYCCVFVPVVMKARVGMIYFHIGNGVKTVVIDYIELYLWMLFIYSMLIVSIRKRNIKIT